MKSPISSVKHRELSVERQVARSPMPSFPQMSYDDDLAFEPARTVTPFGLTDRQALFLVTVMLHSGLFVGRQDNALAGITHGQKVHDFIEKLVAGKFVNSIALGATGRMLNALAFWTIRVLFPTLLVASMEAYTKAAYDLLTNLSGGITRGSRYIGAPASQCRVHRVAAQLRASIALARRVTRGKGQDRGDEALGMSGPPPSTN
jgi:hypothetical protein